MRSRCTAALVFAAVLFTAWLGAKQMKPSRSIELSLGHDDVVVSNETRVGSDAPSEVVKTISSRVYDEIAYDKTAKARQLRIQEIGREHRQSVAAFLRGELIDPREVAAALNDRLRLGGVDASTRREVHTSIGRSLYSQSIALQNKTSKRLKIKLLELGIAHLEQEKG